MLRVKTWPFRSMATLLTIALGCAAPLGCSGKDAAKCKEASEATRLAIKSGQQELLTQWRARAWKYCEDLAALGGLDREIADAQNKALERERTRKHEEQRKTQLVRLLSDFAAAERHSPQDASSSPVCSPPAKGAADKERFCEGTRRAGSYQLKVRYWEAEPAAVRISTHPGFGLTCSDFPGASLVSTHELPARGNQTAERSLCRFAGGPLAGLELVVTSAKNADVHLFTSEYLDKDPAMQVYVGG